VTPRALESPEFAYGNTRLRARKSALLGPTDYESLLGLDIDGLLGSLAATAYGPDLETALPRFHGVRRLHETVQLHLARMLSELRGFYTGTARELVDLLLSSWDVRNLVTLLRGQAARAPVEEVVPLVIPIGRLDEASAREVARQPEFAAAVQLLVAWRLPTPDDAQALAAAWPAYERSADLAALEHALTAARAARVTAALAQMGVEAEPLRAALRMEADDRNLLIALRLREATGGEEPGRPGAEQLFLPGGSVAGETLAAATVGPLRQDIAVAIGTLRGMERLRGPLDRWTASGDLGALQGDVEAARARGRIGLFATGDPLSIAIPIAFVAAVETEARNIRLLGEGAVAGTDPIEIRPQLVTA
jgi:vacuolar-type H+-ATPase subunit C/Vma6